MSQKRQTLIDDLVGDLKPVKRPGRVGAGAAVWLAIASVYSIVIVIATGPLRPGAVANLIAIPTFGIETAVAVLAICATAFAALRSAVPGAHGPVHALSGALVPLVVWAAIYVVGLWYPAHPVSTLGARSHCIWQVVLYSLPTLGLMLYMARRQFPLWPRTTAALAGAAAAAIPGALMQIGCMYVPSHILSHHLTPILITAAIGALVGPFVLRKRAAVGRRPDMSIH